MWSHSFFAVTNTLADHEGTDQTSHRCVDVYDGTACEVQCALSPQPTSSSCHSFKSCSISDGVRTVPIPNHVGDRHVAECEPNGTEQQHSRELDALSKCTNDQGTSDSGKSCLESSEREFRDIHSLAERGSNRIRRDTFEEQFVHASNKWIARCERERVAVQHPQHINQGRHDKNLHQYRQHVFASDQATVEQS